MAFTYDGDGNAVLAGGGTAAAPAIRIRNATNAGIFSSQADQVGVSVSGAVRLNVVPASTTVTNDFVCKSHVETMFRHNFVSGTKALTTDGLQRAHLNGNITFTMPGTAAQHAGRSITLVVRTGTGAFAATFTGVKWPAGNPPTLTQASGKVDVFNFFSDGDNWYGSVVQKYSA